MNDQPAHATHAIDRFIDDWHRLRDDLLSWCTESVSPVGSVNDVLHLVWDRVLDRRGEFGGGAEYVVHGGIGCRITSADGRTVDSDVIDGVETFDPWRVRSHSRSCTPPSDPSIAALHGAMRELAATGHLVALDGRSYAIPAVWPPPSGGPQRPGGGDSTPG